MYNLSKAYKHDIHYLNVIQCQLGRCVLVGDKGYLNQQWQHDLFKKSEIDLQTPKRKNQMNYKKLSRYYRRSRKRIETLFSQLCDQFMIRRNYVKSLSGIARKVVTKITSLTLIQWVNQRAGNKLNNIKVVIS